MPGAVRSRSACTRRPRKGDPNADARRRQPHARRAPASTGRSPSSASEGLLPFLFADAEDERQQYTMVVHNVARRAASATASRRRRRRAGGSTAQTLRTFRRARRRHRRRGSHDDPTRARTVGRRAPSARARSTRSCAGCCRRSATLEHLIRADVADARRRTASTLDARRSRSSTSTTSTTGPSASSSASCCAARSTPRSAPARREPLLFVVLDELNKYAPARRVEPDQGDPARRRRARPLPRDHPDRRAADGERGRAADRRQLGDPRRRPPRLGRGRRAPSTASCRRRSGSGPRSSSPGTMFVSPARDPGAARGRVPVPGLGDPPVGARRATRPRPASAAIPDDPFDGAPDRGPSVKILHTSDWHVGKTLEGASRARRAPRGARRDRRDRRRASASTSCSSSATCSRPRRRRPRPSDRLRRAARPRATPARTGRRHRRQPRQRSRARRGRAGVRRGSASRVLGLPAGPSDGGVVDARAGRRDARVALLPFVSQRCVDPGRAADGARRGRSRAALRGAHAAAASRALARRASAPTRSTSSPRTAWCSGGTLGGGERDAQTHRSSTAVAGRRVPADAHYVALGHLHRAQQIAGAAPDLVLGLAAPGRLRRGADTQAACSSSTAEPRRRRRSRQVRARRAARPLRTVRGTLAELARRGAARSATRGCGSSCASRRAPGSADEVRDAARRTRSTCALEPRRRGRRRRRRAACAGRAARPHELFAEYLAERGRRRRPRSSRCSTSCSTTERRV